MDETWQLSVLAAGTENAQYVAGGAETTVAAAAAAAADALVAVAEQRGRQEYRLTVGTTQLVITPGLTENGHIDVHAARDAVLSVARDAGARPDCEEIAVRVRFAADGVSGMWHPVLANGVAAALHAVLSEFDRHAYCADGHVWINPEDNGGDRGRIEHNRALLVRCPGRRVLVVGHDPVAHEVRALLADGCAGWDLYRLPEKQVLLEEAELMLGHRAYNMLTREGFRTVEEVAATPDAALLNIRNIGPKSLAAIQDMATAHEGGLLGPAPAEKGGVVEGIGALHAMTTDQLVTVWAGALRELQRRGALTALPAADAGAPPSQPCAD
jgi:hypothetical protein